MSAPTLAASATVPFVFHFDCGDVMTQIVRCAIALFFAISLCSTASALPPLPAYVGEYYKSQPEYAKFAEVFAGLKMKCDTCHTPGADKKTKGHGLNDFGKAVHDNFKHKDFLAANKAKDNAAELAKAKRLVADALTAAAAEKNPDGKTYGDLLKAGQMPGKN
jgi:hypothetical protein